MILSNKFGFILETAFSYNAIGFNGVTDTLESSSILIYLIQVKGIYTRQNVLIKTRNWINEIQKEAPWSIKLERHLN